MTIPKEHVDNLPKIISESGLDSSVRVEPGDVNTIRFIITNLQNEELISAIEIIRLRLCADSKIEVNGSLIYNGTEFANKIDFSNCIFNEDVIFRNCVFKNDVLIKSSEFKKRTSFKKSIFEAKTRFHCSKFKTSVDFENTVFKNLADFYEAAFYEPQQFFLTDFLNVTIFSNVTFHNQTQFLYNKVGTESIISFESATFKQALDISRANFWCKVHFWNIEVETIPSKLWLYQTDDIKEIEIKNGLIAFRRIRESYRIIKNEFTKEGNLIESLDYHSYEMVIYGKEISQERKKRISDCFLLWLSENSNNFGTSWQKGLLFTTLVTLIFYILFLLTLWPDLVFDLSGASIGNTLRHFVEFLNVAKWDIQPFGIQNYSWGYIILFIGRIFIAYGYYQTIQAFRKYVRK